MVRMVPIRDGGAFRCRESGLLWLGLRSGESPESFSNVTESDGMEDRPTHYKHAAGQNQRVVVEGRPDYHQDDADGKNQVESPDQVAKSPDRRDSYVSILTRDLVHTWPRL
jgi:hypothetical protein